MMIKWVAFLSVLTLAALGLAIVQQWNVENIIVEQRAAIERSKALEAAVNQRVSDTSTAVVKKVEQLEQSSPKVVTGYNGDLSLSVPVQPAPVGAVTLKPATRPHVKRASKDVPAAPAASGAAAPAPTDYVLVPLKTP
jgi:hypothetical protein